MKQNNLLFSFLFILVVFNSCQAQHLDQNTLPSKTKNTIVFLNPTIEPEVEEIKKTTNDAFFSSVTEYISSINNVKMLRVQMPVNYENESKADIMDACKNNDAQFAVVSKIKFFKVGFGKYILSSQVIVSMKLYDASGNFISENSYDTFRKKARILGSAENSIKIGTVGAIKMMRKDWRKNRRSL